MKPCRSVSATSLTSALNKPLKGHFAKADVAPKKALREFRAG